MTHYEILGVSKNATQKEIRDAYKKLVKKYHPDLYQGDKQFAEKRTQEINNAYDILSNEKTKMQYDDEITPKVTYEYTPPKYNYEPPRYNTYTSSYNNTKSNRESYFGGYSQSKNTTSNYTTKTSNDKIIKVFLIATAIIIAYIILFVSSYIKIKDMQMTKEVYTEKPTQEYLEIEKEPTDGIDLNDYFTDEELYDIYVAYYKDSFDTYQEFKSALTEYIQSYYDLK